MQNDDALWYVSEERAELRPAVRSPLRDGQVLVQARYSGLSRGTERLVFRGQVPSSEYNRMRCPHQEGDFPFPVKYGYALVGEIVDGPKDKLNKPVFLLHPHQRCTCVAESDVHFIPEGLPLRRATLAANMETALNIVWDASLAPGDQVLVVGGGTVGLLTAALAARSAATRVTVTDINPHRARVAQALGAHFAEPPEAPHDQDIVIHTSGSEDGLQLALHCAGLEANVVEASWYGDKRIKVDLGSVFHSRRLRLISSQVGTIPPHRRSRWTTARRLKTALELLREDVYDELISEEIPFDDAPSKLSATLSYNSPGITTIFSYL